VCVCVCVCVKSKRFCALKFRYATGGVRRVLTRSAVSKQRRDSPSRTTLRYTLSRCVGTTRAFNENKQERLGRFISILFVLLFTDVAITPSPVRVSSRYAGTASTNRRRPSRSPTSEWRWYDINDNNNNNNNNNNSIARAERQHA